MKVEYKRAGMKTIIMAMGLYLIVAAGNFMLDMMFGSREMTMTGVALAGVAGIFGLLLVYLKYYITEKSLGLDKEDEEENLLTYKEVYEQELAEMSAEDALEEISESDDEPTGVEENGEEPEDEVEFEEVEAEDNE